MWSTSSGQCARSWRATGDSVLKRAFDLAVTLAGLIVLAPFFVVVALLIKCDSRGPIFYLGDRIGQHGRPFKILKFRSMIVNADRQGPAITYGDDPRITRVGGFLRRTKLDELPQLWNVLRGEMSLVGPRPEAPCYVALYTPEQRQVLTVRPGITGPTQLIYRDEEEWLSPGTWELDYVNILMPQKLALDLEYVRQQSFTLDVQIVARTIWLLVRDRLANRNE
ncbi:MAG: sugar transferase [Anaerolineae bacterium]|nr:sugar transferase [Anaerolineae bacterium]